MSNEKKIEEEVKDIIKDYDFDSFTPKEREEFIGLLKNFLSDLSEHFDKVKK